MVRSVWKGLYISKNITKFILNNLKKYDIMFIYSRNSIILEEFIGMHFRVYNGIRFFNIFVSEKNIGYKFGEFAYTRKLSRNIHYKKDLKKKK